eukprot:COSAG02_NODE_46195_length_351_cov_0.575397_1_plen_39_part_01
MCACGADAIIKYTGTKVGCRFVQTLRVRGRMPKKGGRKP